MSYGLFALPTKYGYNLGITHPIIGAFYSDFFRRFKLPEKMGMGDSQRIEYENLLWNYIRSIYKKYDPKSAGFLPPISDKYFLFTKVIGWQEELLNLFLTEKLNLPKALEQFAKKYSDKLAPIAEELKPSEIYLEWVNGNYDREKERAAS